MISLEKIVSSNLEMLKSQEEELLKSLHFVQQAKQLFQKHWGITSESPAKRRGRPSGKTVTPNVAAAPRTRKKRKAIKSKTTTTGKTKRVSHLSNIISTLKQNGKPMGSGDVISALFKKQSAVKDIKRFRLLIYPVLTKAYKTKTLTLKDKKIHLNK